MSTNGVNRFQQADPRALQKTQQARFQGLEQQREKGAGTQVQPPQAQQVQFQGGLPQSIDALKGPQGLSQTALTKFGENGPNQINAFQKLAQNMNPNQPAPPHHWGGQLNAIG